MRFERLDGDKDQSWQALMAGYTGHFMSSRKLIRGALLARENGTAHGNNPFPPRTCRYVDKRTINSHEPITKLRNVPMIHFASREKDRAEYLK
jgi:hypothetical protein